MLIMYVYMPHCKEDESVFLHERSLEILYGEVMIVVFMKLYYGLLG